MTDWNEIQVKFLQGRV